MMTEVVERIEASLERAVPDDRYVPRPPSVPSVVYERLAGRSFAAWRARAHEKPKTVVIGGAVFTVRPALPSDGDVRVYWGPSDSELKAEHDEMMRRKYERMAFSHRAFERHIEQGGSIEDY